MGGGLMQLVAYGAQDIYLTGNPQITFFKVVYRRHTNFSMEAIQQTLQGTPAFGGTTTATISRNGDLVSHLYVQFNPNLVLTGSGAKNFCPNAGHALLKETEIEIGGQRIDRHYSHWLNAWGTLTGQLGYCQTDTAGKFRVSPQCVAAGGELVATPTMYQKMAFCCKDGMVAAAPGPGEIFATVPLQFWFCNNPGLALPLIALQYHEVKVKITFPGINEILSAGDATGSSLTSVELWADYIYLDTDERRRFAQVSHEYLITQLQYQSESAAKTFVLNFNHPVKELIWAGARDASANCSKHGGPSTPNSITLATGSSRLRETTGTTCTLKLNGHERFAPRHDNYFTRTQVWQHHHKDRGSGADTDQGDAVHVYSFALKPEEHQPSGTCNFSRIDNAQLVYSSAVGGTASGGLHLTGLHIYAVNYNVLRIMSGMGGLAYSN